MSNIVRSTTPAALSMSAMRVPAAPAPLTTTLSAFRSLPASVAKFMTPASAMTAVPHWSSWKTGMSSSASSRSSISKQAGAAMSSRLMPPYCGAIAFTAAMTRSGSVLPAFAPPARQALSGTGQASTPAKLLKRTAFPSMTGIDAVAPRSPRPRIAVPSETTATRFDFAVTS